MTRLRLAGREDALPNPPLILVVEDNPDHRELTVAALAQCCSPDLIATADDGTGALEYLFGTAPTPGATRDSSHAW